MKNKKIGIITVHRNVNFGANLQAFASCRYLKNSGYAAQVIDYTPAVEEAQNHLISWLYTSWKKDTNPSLVHKAKLLISLVLSAGWKARRLKAFTHFRRQYMSLTVRCQDEKAIAALNLDGIVCGSDQIWNPEITEGINPLYFGDVSGIPLRVSYAASMGRAKLDIADEQKAAALIKQMNYCSVREAATADYVQEISGKMAECVCDPVFLLDREEYTTLIAQRIEKRPYILLYSVVRNDAMTALAVEYAKQRKIQLIELGAEQTRCKTHRQLAGIGPLEFLNYFYFADTIITNSFHGTAFAIIFEKQFYAVDNKARGTRISNLLNKAGLANRMVDSIPSVNEPTIDYAAVRDNMADYVAGSKTFLQQALSCQEKPVIEANCTGCAACQAICGKDAICLTKNREGFLQAIIDTQKCVDCGLCRTICPSLNKPVVTEFPQETWAFKAENTIRQTSTSGGAFSALAQEVLDQGGSVYAVGELEHSSVRHCRCTTAEDIARARGVKYIQSDFSACYTAVADDLQADKTVLVTGTPCQIAGIRKFTEQKRLPTGKLYLADIICHGIPSPSVFQQYMAWLEKKYGCAVKTYYFRNKAVSWRGASCRAILADGHQLDNTRELNCFLNIYYSGNITNEPCYACSYAAKERISDITISDYWGIENCLPAFEDALGVSMVLLNSGKGKQLFMNCVGEKQTASIEAAKQPQLITPCERPRTREIFWKQYFSQDTEKLFKRYGGYQKQPRLLQYLKSLLRKVMKRR